jgi:pyrroloquinoline quinone biosynthesis protein B
VLAADVVGRHPVAIEIPVELSGGMTCELFPVPGKVPLYQETDASDLTGPRDINAGVEIRAGGASLVYIPGAAALTPTIQHRMRDADVILFDGTLFSDDEMIRGGTGEKTGLRMGHMPISGADGSLAALSGLSNRKIYTHINNTNPVLVEGSAERLQVEAAGWEVAYDGMEIAL